MSRATITINGDTADFATIYNSIRTRDQGFHKQVLSSLLIRQHAKKIGISVSEEELQKAVDESRYLLGMEKADVFKEWLSSNNLSHAGFETSVEDAVIWEKILSGIKKEQIDAYLTENAINLEAVELYHMRLEDKDTAEEIKSQLTDNEANFLQLAFENSKDAETSLKGGYLGFLKRSDVVGEIEAAVFGANEGDILGPIKTPKGYNLFLIKTVVKPDKSSAYWQRIGAEKILDDLIKTALGNAKITCDFLG